MERVHVLVIVAVVAAVGLFGLRLISERRVQDDLATTALDGEASKEGRLSAGRASSDSASGSTVGGDSGRGRSGSASDRASASDGGSRRSDRTSRLAAALKGEHRGAAAIPGQAGGGSGGAGPGLSGGRTTGAAVGGIGGGSDPLAPKRLDSNQPRRADVVEYLASQPASNPNGSLREDENNQEVALELKRPEDADPASVKEEIKSPDSDEDGLTFTEDSVLAFPDGGNVNGDAGTISFQIEPNWGGGDETNNSLVTLRGEHEWANRLELVKNGRYLRFILSDANGREADISVPIDAWQAGDSHDVQATWGNSRTSLFIDGVLVGQNTYSEFKRPDAPLFIGSDHRGSTYSGMNGTVRDFKVTNSASHVDS